MVLLLLLTARCRRTRKAGQKCPEKQDKKSKRDMKYTIVKFFPDCRDPAKYGTSKPFYPKRTLTYKAKLSD